MDYIPHTPAEIETMLRTIGVVSIEELLSDIPAEARCRSFDLPPGLAETDVLAELEQIALPNRSLRELGSFLGFGAYHHVIPTVVDAVSARGEWLTPYTPYQAEASQGTLQMIYEFQTLVCELMQMDVANASLYDGASALAEAALVALRSSGRSRLLVSEAIHPHARQVLSTYLSGFPSVIQQMPFRDGVTDLNAVKAAMGDDVAAVLMQQPNVFGCLEPMAEAGRLAHDRGALFVASVYPISLGELAPPGAYDADIAVAEGRCLGSPVAFGGPALGLFAASESLLRRMPGRLSGCTVDQTGRRGFTLTLQTREQHIRREKATSNICTNQGWFALRATIFLSLLGPQGIRELAEVNAERGHRLAERLVATGAVEPVFNQPFFNECTLRFRRGVDGRAIGRKLLKAGLLAGVDLRPWYPMLGEASVWCATELNAQPQIDRLAEALRDAAQRASNARKRS